MVMGAAGNGRMVMVRLFQCGGEMVSGGGLALDRLWAKVISSANGLGCFAGGLGHNSGERGVCGGRVMLYCSL